MSCGITGASGHLGSGILRCCLGRVPSRELVAVTRQPAKMAAIAARGVEVREGDFDKPGLEHVERLTGRRAQSALEFVSTVLVPSAVDA